MKKLLILLTAFLIGLNGCKNKKTPTITVNLADYLKAETFLNTKPDSAFYYFNKFTTISKDSLQIARAYNRMAAIQSDAGDHFGAQETLLTSLRYLNDHDEKDNKCLAADYNELGLSSVDLKNYDAAVSFYQKALQFTDNNNFKYIISSNIANAYQEKGDYAMALNWYQITIKKGKKDGPDYARLLTNLAITKWLQHSSYNASTELMKALLIRQKKNDHWGENSSYAHLSDYYAKSQPDSALLYAQKLYSVSSQLHSPDDELKALKKLIRLGSVFDTKNYFARYEHLNDSIQTTRNTAKNQFALIRYNVEKNKADNLKLQKDNTGKRYEIIKQQILLAVALLLIILGAIWYSRRKKRLETEALNKIRDHEFKVSKKVHDVVANGLYVVMNEIENQQELSRGVLLDQIEVLYERSRDISYEKPENVNDDFTDKISKLLTSFAGATIKIAIAGNNKSLWRNVSLPVKYELEQVLKELMVNMKKHSAASQTVIKFRQDGDRITIDYTDNGIGLPTQVQYGNGLTSTGNRIQAINGMITFDNQTKKGTRIQITFPVI